MEVIMCYGCELQSTLGDDTVPEYLEILRDHTQASNELKKLLGRMLRFEQTISDEAQRKAWHATRARIKQGRAEINDAVNRMADRPR